MGDEFFQDGVYGESLWINSTKNIFNISSSILDPIIIGQYNFAWPSEFLDMKINRSNDDYRKYSCSGDTMVFQELPKSHNFSSMDSTLQILGITGNSSSPSSSSPDWNQSINDSILQENLNSSQNYQQENGVDCSKNQDFNYYSDLLQTLFDSTDEEQQPQQSFNYSSSSTNNHRQNLNGFATSLPKINSLFFGINFQNNSSNIEEPAYKRQRIETPSPLPTFKVRKEKLGDRITALQQLVSPFGKTDTASVLQEAIDYINFLHDQVNVLTTPYMKNGSTPQVKKLQEGLKQGIRSKGLCLVPISSTFPIAAETTMDFWTPTLGGTFR
ncbi:hypothetical protein HAX54_009385 [Datura stramonium]|uniref:BHLH domain-containing protein n=1 Tax=Datura stramonium TaxID=4076 RepID=A0ABS8RW17_DATST|nr:hypothetical protein [Datura stramonium]